MIETNEPDRFGRDWIDLLCKVGCTLTLLFGGILALTAWSKGFATTTPRTVLFIGLPLLLVFIAAVLLFLDRSNRKLGCLCAVFAGLAVLAAELVVGSHVTTPAVLAPNSTERAAIVELEEAFQAGVVPPICPQMLYANGPNGVQFFLEGGDGQPLLPLAGPSDRRVGRIASSEVTVAPNDRFGFNNPDAVWDRPTSVLLIGDSFTYGADVPFGAGYSDYVRDEILGTVNLGCGGNGPLSALAALTEYGPLLKPSIVVWGYYEGNDLTKDIHKEAANPMLLKYLERHEGSPQRLANRQGEIDRVLNEFVADEAQARQNRAVQEGLAESPPPDAPMSQWMRRTATLYHLRSALGLSQDFSPEALALADRVLARMQDIVSAWGGRLVVFHIPSETRWLNPIAEADVAAYTARVRTVAESHSAQWISAAPVLAASADNPRQMYRGHFTKKGYRIAGEELATFLSGILQ